MVQVVKKVNTVYFYKIMCPYCALVNSYLIEPIEYLGLARIEKVNISITYTHKYMALNERISKLLGKAEPIAPLLYDVDNDVVFVPFAEERESASEAISNFVLNVVEHLCKYVVVYDEVRRVKRYLSPRDFGRDPRVFNILKANLGGAR